MVAPVPGIGLVFLLIGLLAGEACGELTWEGEASIELDGAGDASGESD